MIRRYFINELVEFFAMPFQWLGFILASMLLLLGLDQLNLDASRARVLILDSPTHEEHEEEAQKVRDLVQEIAGVEAFIKTPTHDLVKMIDSEDADIILNSWGNRWQATLRSRSIQDHRRLARLGFAIATVINRQTPWDAVVGSDLMAPQDYGKTACEIGRRICAVYRSIGHPDFDALCESPVDDEERNGTKEGVAANNKTDDNEMVACDQKGTDQNAPVLKDAKVFDRALKKACDPAQVYPDQVRGICINKSAPSLLAVVGLTSNPAAHTRAFVPRTICLLVVLFGFVIGCRSIMRDTRYNLLNTQIAAAHGRMSALIAAKVGVAVIYCLLLYVALLIFSSYYFDLSIKSGLSTISLLIFIGSLSSVMLGIAVAIVSRSETTVYLIGSVYLLLLFIFSGYIDEIRESNLLVWMTSYLLPLKHMISPFSSWMMFGASPTLAQAVPAALLSQCLGFFMILLFALEYYRRRT
jgi:hypothetical protein